MLDLTLNSNYLTDAMGEAYQHVEYLPFGEIFLEERNTGQDKNTYLYNVRSWTRLRACTTMGRGIWMHSWEDF